MEAYEWGPDPENLLRSLKSYSDALVLSIKESTDSIQNLSRSCLEASISIENIKNRFELLSLSHDITQRIQDTSHLFLALESGPVSGPGAPDMAATSEGNEDVMHKYLEALRLGAEALKKPLDTERYNRPLPYLYGSPEYLQHDHIGLSGPTSSGTVPPPLTTQDLLNRAFSGLPSSYGASSSLQELASTPGSQEGPRDFMAMLDRALQGQLNDEGDADDAVLPGMAATAAQFHEAAGPPGGSLGAVEPPAASTNTAGELAGLVSDARGSTNTAGELAGLVSDARGSTKSASEPAGPMGDARGLPAIVLDGEGLFDDDDDKDDAEKDRPTR
eukprot:jgi/Botrbrau1/16978/Bobra.49_2s0038.1